MQIEREVMLGQYQRYGRMLQRMNATLQIVLEVELVVKAFLSH
ncbi:hypothetical protein GBAR_LOCUS10424 [Geodia barretti]|uniref:Uncharacterized protein n=1 Tax=Geodia barretti TaxID=519541 RepID=A0AA35RSU1_GEOBA|nr:hypothetical protein GBAR_LOCUS10424 [Geodia barretti]